MSNNSIHQELAKLREENDNLHAELMFMKEAYDAAKTRLMRHFHLTKKEAIITNALADGRMRDRGVLLELAQINSEEERVIDNHVRRIRKKISPLKIMAQYGLGYYAPPETVAALREVISKEMAAP